MVVVHVLGRHGGLGLGIGVVLGPRHGSVGHWCGPSCAGLQRGRSPHDSSFGRYLRLCLLRSGCSVGLLGLLLLPLALPFGRPACFPDRLWCPSHELVEACIRVVIFIIQVRGCRCWGRCRCPRWLGCCNSSRAVAAAAAAVRTDCPLLFQLLLSFTLHGLPLSGRGRRRASGVGRVVDASVGPLVVEVDGVLPVDRAVGAVGGAR